MALKSPKLYLRQACVNDLTKKLTPGKFLEIGAGIGIMTTMFLEKGFHGFCQDISPESINFLKINLQNFTDYIRIIDNFSGLSNENFDYLLAFEVLEHIDDDLNSLIEWSAFLKKGGYLIASVPAHKKKFSIADKNVGHVRRYEKSELYRLLKNAGYSNIKIVNYGFPITELSRIIGSWMLTKDNALATLSNQEKNLASSYSSTPIIRRYLALLDEKLYIPFKYIQRWFYSIDIGDGFVVVAQKQ